MTVAAERLKWTVRRFSGPTKALSSLDWRFQVTLTSGSSSVSGVVAVPLADVDWLRELAAQKSVDAGGVVREFLDRVLRSEDPASDGWSLALTRDAGSYWNI